MQENITQTPKFYKKKKINHFYLSLASFGFIIIVTLGLYFYNLKLQKDIKDLDNNISLKQKSIDSLEKDPKIVAAKLYNLNRSSIKKLEDYSKITTYIKHLYKLQRVYNINFKGFNFNSGNLQTQVIASSDSIGINYQKVYNFLTKYRKSSEALFNLNLVKAIESKQEGISDVFNANFILKNNIDSIINKSLKENQIKEKQKRLEIKKKLEKIKQKIKQKTNSGQTNK